MTPEAGACPALVGSRPRSVNVFATGSYFHVVACTVSIVDVSIAAVQVDLPVRRVVAGGHLIPRAPAWSRPSYHVFDAMS